MRGVKDSAPHGYLRYRRGCRCTICREDEALRALASYSTKVVLRNVPANTIVYLNGRWGVTEGPPGRGKKRVVDFWWEGREHIASDISVEVAAK